MSNGGWWPIVLDCVDLTDILVGHQNLTADIGPVPKLSGATTGPSISPPLLACARNVTCGPSSKVVDLKDVALLARNDHVVSKCAHYGRT